MKPKDDKAERELRDYFAGCALSAFIIRGSDTTSMAGVNHTSVLAYVYADSMLVERRESERA